MRRANTIIGPPGPAYYQRPYGFGGLTEVVDPPVKGASPVYWWVDDVLRHKGWLMPTQGRNDNG